MRIDRWDVALAAYLKECADAPFVWGKRDCSLFASDAVLAMTGVDHGAEYRDQYDTAVGAYKRLAKDGGVSSIADKALGDRIPWQLLQRGDLAAMESGYHHDALGVVSLDGKHVVMMRDRGTDIRPISKAKHGWRV